MHNFVNTCVNFKLSWIDQCCISDTSDDRHSGSLNQMSVKSVLFYKIFDTVYIFLRSMRFQNNNHFLSSSLIFVL